MFVRRNICPICNSLIKKSNIGYYYPNAVCENCDKKALTKENILAIEHFKNFVSNSYSNLPFRAKDAILNYKGPNPVYINGIKCWRKYTIGGWVTMVDKYNCRTYEEFEKINFY